MYRSLMADDLAVECAVRDDDALRRTVYDVCAVGHITRDLVRIGDQFLEQPGGSAYYLSLALHRLGRQVAVITKMAAADESFLLSEFKAESIDVSCTASPTTTNFENVYLEGNPDLRVQKVGSIAAQFSTSDLSGIRARFFHLGPLTKGEMPLDFLRAVSANGDVSLDVQGLIRSVDGHEIKTEAWSDMEEGLSVVSILKADAEEATILTGENDAERAAQRLVQLVGREPREVIVTLGSRGSIICSTGGLCLIPPVPASNVVDTTGCGDTFLAAYLHCRLDSEDIERAGHFAAAAATLKLEHFGPFRGADRDVKTRSRLR